MMIYGCFLSSSPKVHPAASEASQLLLWPSQLPLRSTKLHLRLSQEFFKTLSVEALSIASEAFLSCFWGPLSFFLMVIILNVYESATNHYQTNMRFNFNPTREAEGTAEHVTLLQLLKTGSGSIKLSKAGSESRRITCRLWKWKRKNSRLPHLWLQQIFFFSSYRNEEVLSFRFCRVLVL